MSDTQDLGQLLQNVTTRAIAEPASRNRPVNLYANNYETATLEESLASITLLSTANWAWTSAGSTVSLWGHGQWRSS